MKPGTYIVAVVVAGFVLIAWLFYTSPATAPNQLPLIIAAVAGLATLLAKQAETAAKVEEVAVVASQSVAVSTDNAHALAVVSEQVDSNTAITDHANKQIRELKITVDGRLQALLEQTALASNLSGQQQGAQDERDRTPSAEATAITAQQSEARIIAAIAASPVASDVPTVEAPVVVVAPKAVQE